ncbi:MAG: hypothetical protein AMS15_06690 [Planctomycetes bacterium DG_23]|nr:MAG: hypothetical protein AMS15_06690 [Planctomycetes bacterium DG_23]
MALQEELVGRLKKDKSAPGYLILLQHPPVFTIGRSGGEENLLASSRRLKEEGIKVYQTRRGGNITYHGPGQLVGYPILDLGRIEKDVHKFLRRLEEVIIRALADFGIKGERENGLTGVWVNGKKIAAIGVAISRWVTYHGFALNVAPNLAHFALIHPCGISGRGVTSLENILGRKVELEEVIPPLVGAFGDVFGLKVEEESDTRTLEETSLSSSTAGRAPLALDQKPSLASTRERPRFPPWLKKRLHPGTSTDAVRALLKGLRLHTVCQEARCPNLSECFARKTAAFLILGDVCTRSCSFCAVSSGKPTPVDKDEPRRVAEAAARMRLKYVVITSVTRDDLPDGGSGHFARTISAVRRRTGARIEVLTPDFGGRREDILRVASRRPDVYNHNLETVRRLYPEVRPQADYQRSLRVLQTVKEEVPGALTKSGLMLGLGEERNEVLEALAHLREVGTDILTLGQYLSPSKEHLPIRRFVHPDEFAEYKERAEGMGFLAVASGPWVRSSFCAETVFADASFMKDA